jgi:hypothetical protein
MREPGFDLSLIITCVIKNVSSFFLFIANSVYYLKKNITGKPEEQEFTSLVDSKSLRFIVIFLGLWVKLYYLVLVSEGRSNAISRL